MKVSIIGSGIAGLTAGCYMSRDGHDVTIYEQFPDIGGITATLRQEGYGWDLGPLLLEGFGPNEHAGEVLADLNLSDKVQTIYEDRGLAFPDFDLWKPQEYAGPYWRREKLKTIFPQEANGLDRYYDFYDQMMDLMALARRSDKQSGLPKLLTKLQLMLAFRKVKHMESWSAEQVMDHFFKDEKLKGIFTSIQADLVIKPNEFQGLAIPAFNVESAFEKRIPQKISKAGERPIYHYIGDGCGAMVAAMAAMIRSNKGKILTNTSVKIIAVENGRVKGIILDDNSLHEADLVIASGGARECFLDMVGRENLTPDYIKAVENVAFMESVLMVHVGIDFDPTPYQRAALCYYIGAYDVDAGVQRCRSGDYHEGADGFLIYIPSMHSPNLAPPGHHAVTVYTIAPNKLNKGDWTELREEMADELLAYAENIIPGLRERSTTRSILTPDDFKKRTHLKHHSFGGACPVMGRPGAPHKTPIDGLWFVGAQSESMGGVANVMSSTSRVMKTIRREKNT